jgi:Uma2 family endonuclease
MPYIKRDTQHHTYSDYAVWSAEYGNELIDGVAYVREPPSPSWRHQELAGALFGHIWPALQDKPCRVFAAPLDVRLPKSNETDDEVDTVVQPDVFIVCDSQKLDKHGVRGAPDWVAEILSPSTRSHDQKRKIPVYERAGVQEVWLIDPHKRTLATYRLEDGCYGPPTLQTLRGQTQLTAVPGLNVDWDKLLSQLLPD